VSGRGTEGARFRRRTADPYAKAPTGELSEPLLPRWFVVLAVVLVPVALAVFLITFPLLGDRDEVPVVERRPPPAEERGLSHDVGELEVGSSEPRLAEPGCSAVQGFAVAGAAGDRERLESALDALCETGVPGEAGPAIAALRDARAVVRFAVFERTGVDSTLDVGADPSRVLINARFVRAEQPRWITPLIVHEAVVFAGEVGTVETALAARRAQLAACEALFGPDELSQGCDTAAELLALDDPAAALRDAGYR
jgi:hypothetical protein